MPRRAAIRICVLILLSLAGKGTAGKLLKDERLAPHFVIELRRVERLDEITVVVEARSDADNGVFAACDRDLAHHIKELMGVTATVRTVKPGTVERSLGKAKRVIDLRSKS